MTRAGNKGDGVAAAMEDSPAAENASPKPSLRKRELIDRIAAETGLKKRQVKAATEALLAEMGQAVDRGETLVLEPFGRMRIARTTDRDGGRTLTCKLRRKAG